MRSARAITRYLVAAAASLLPGGLLAADNIVIGKIQRTLDDYIAQRHEIEGISGVALHVDLGDRGPVYEAYSGTRGPRDPAPINADTLFQIGSNTKHFEAAVVLRLEAEGKLNIGQTVGDWLPEYSAWKNVTIRRLLNMTSTIPNYSETVAIGQIIATDLDHQFTDRQLIAAAYPGPDNSLPRPSGWFYSNTNNILAALIIEKASGRSLKEQFETLFRQLDLHDTFYAEGRYPEPVLKRVPVGLYQNADCLLYQPEPCQRSTLAPLMGKDMRRQNLSWAGGAGAIISNPRDLAKWVRALFGGRVIPQRQLDEMTALVSQKTAATVTQATDGNPAFGLDLVQAYRPDLGGRYWYYQGETLGYRCIFAYWPQYDLVMTVATNSQPPAGTDQLGAFVLGRVLPILFEAKVIAPNVASGPSGSAPASRH